MKVTLIAHPPIGDKVADELRKLDGVELNHLRNLHDNGPCPVLPQDTRFVLVMNGGGWGVALKENARKAGAAFIAIPANWSSTQMRLAENHFYDALKNERAATRAAQPLTHRPLERVREVVVAAASNTAPVAVATEPAPPAVTVVAQQPQVIAGPGSDPLAREARNRQRALIRAMLEKDDGALARRLSEDGYEAYVADRAAAGDKEVVGYQVFANERRDARARLGIERYVVTATRVAWCRRFIREQPTIPSIDVVLDAVRKEYGTGVDTNAISKLLVAERARRDHAARAAIVDEHSLPTAPVVFSGIDPPNEVRTLERQLVEALKRSAGGIVSYVLTFVGGTEPSVEREYEPTSAKMRVKL